MMSRQAEGCHFVRTDALCSFAHWTIFSTAATSPSKWKKALP
jgi:hypothetical protein